MKDNPLQKDILPFFWDLTYQLCLWDTQAFTSHVDVAGWLFSVTTFLLSVILTAKQAFLFTIP